MKKKIIKDSSYLLISFFLLFNPVRAQEQKILSDSLYSQILKEERHLNIVFPKNYDTASTEKHEIVYCLDDIADFLRIEWGMLQWEGFIPKNMIMVGITNTKHNDVDMRDRDFTPTKISDISGGAEKFHLFIKSELIPFINRKYNGDNKGNVLYGGSLGGLFVMYSLLHDPALFTSYIAIDPSLWWDNHLLIKTAAAIFDSVKALQNTLFIAGREGNMYREMGVAGMDSILKEKAPQGLDWKCVTYRNETHYSTNFKGFWDGLKFSYGGYYSSTGGYITSRKIVIKPKTGIVLKDEPFKLLSYNLLANKYLHYTTDGTEPCISSPTLSGEETHLTLSKDSKIIVKSIGVRKEYNRIDSAYFVVGDIFKSIPKLKNAKPGSLQYSYYEGTWDSFPDVKHLKPAMKGFTDENFDITKLDSKKDFVCIMKGYLKINRKGYYILEMGGGNQYSRVYLNNQLILGQYFIIGEGEMYLAPLEAGFYPFRIEYFHKTGGEKLAPIYIKPESVEDYAIPPEMLYIDSN